MNDAIAAIAIKLIYHRVVYQTNSLVRDECKTDN